MSDKSGRKKNAGDWWLTQKEKILRTEAKVYKEKCIKMYQTVFNGNESDRQWIER